MNTWTTWGLLALACLAVLLTGCETSGPIMAGVGAGIAGAVSVVDQLLIAGQLTAEQAAALKGGFTESQAAIDALQKALDSKGDPALVAGGTTGAILAALKAWAMFQGSRKSKAKAA